MSPHQQRFLLASYGGRRRTADLILSDLAVRDARAFAFTGSLPTPGEQFTTTSRGIEHHVRGKAPVVVIPWSAFTAHRAGLSRSALERLEAASAACRAHSRTYPSVYPDLGVRTLDSGFVHPDDRDLYAERAALYQLEVVAPWRGREDQLEQALAQAVLDCLPDRDVPGSGDLLDLLHQVHAPRPPAVGRGLTSDDGPGAGMSR